MAVSQLEMSQLPMQLDGAGDDEEEAAAETGVDTSQAQQVILPQALQSNMYFFPIGVFYRPTVDPYHQRATCTTTHGSDLLCMPCKTNAIYS